MIRLAILAIVNSSLLAAEPPPAPAHFRASAPKVVSEIHAVTLQANGSPDVAGQAELDRLVDSGWRAISITPLPTPAGTPVRVAVLFSRLARPSAPMRAATAAPH